MRKQASIILVTICLVGTLLAGINFSASASPNLILSQISSFPGQMMGSAFTSNGTLFAGDINNHLYRSDNNGSTFRLVYTFPTATNPSTEVAGYQWTVYVDSRNQLFVSIPATNALYRSINYGASFAEVLNAEGSAQDGFYIGITEDSMGSLYVATYCNSIYPELPAVLKSTDGGNSWNEVLTVRAIHLHNVAYNSYNGYLYAVTGEYATYGSYYNDDHECVYRSKDNGASWTKIITYTNPGGYGDTIFLPVVFNGNDVYFGTDRGVTGETNWIAKIADDGSNRLFTPQVVYNMPDSDAMPVLSGAKLGDAIVFCSTSEFNDGVARLIASTDGSSWTTLETFYAPAAYHHLGMLSKNVKGIAFVSGGPNLNFALTQATSPPPTTTPTPTPTPPPGAPVVFSDDFSSGNFNQWTAKYTGSGASQSVSGGVAQFNTPGGGNGVYSCVLKSGFTSGTTDVITASQDVFMNEVPSGFSTGLGAIFVLYLTDTADYNNGNIQVGIDGSQKWGIYVGGYPTFTYTIQTSGTTPQSKTWYHIELQIDNSNRTATLTVNGTKILSVVQNQFTDKTHTVGLSTGIGEDWCNTGRAHQLQVDNVKLSISGATQPTPTPTPTATATPSPTPTSTPTPAPTATPTPTPTPTASPTPTPTSTGTPLSNAIQVKANVTVTAINYQAAGRLYVTVTKSGTNYIEATISRTTLPNINNLRVYINNVQKSYTYSTTSTDWIVSVLTT